jgi:hypothetical protein
MGNKIRHSAVIIFVFSLIALCPAAMAGTAEGYTLHFDFINSWEDARQLIVAAHGNGAEILNVVPPARIWKLKESQKILRNIFDLTRTLRMQVVLSRIDACAPAADDPKRYSYLFEHILKRRGILPTGEATPAYFRETVGLARYEKWMREETEYYSRNYSGEENLAGFSVGLFNEPFVSQRGSLLCYDFATNSYEIAQYTKPCLEYWQSWLKKKYLTPNAVNGHYKTSFRSFSSIPMPRCEHDARFGASREAYIDLVSSINDWVLAQYVDCRAIWRKHAKRPVPVIQQFSGYVPEKFSKGRPAFAMLDIYSWMQEADALGLSLYTDAEYPDRGHASDKSMINSLYLGVLEQKHIFVMEGGNEDDGPVLIPQELEFFVGAARVLRPDGYIYEFFKAPFYAQFAHNEGYMLGADGAANKDAVAMLRGAINKSDKESALSGEIYVYDNPATLSTDNDDLNVQKQLQVAALTKTLVFVPEGSLKLLPKGSILLVIQQERKEDIFKQLAAKGIKIIPAREWLKNSSVK